jgi:hypothetical protein
MRGKIFGSVLGLGLMLAGPAQLAFGAAQASAEEWHGRGGDDGGYYHRDHDGIGAGGIILGLAAVAGVAALASSASHHDGYYDRGNYGGYGGYGGYGAPAYGYNGGSYGGSYGAGYNGGSYGGGYNGGGYYGNGYDTRAAVSYCSSAAVGQARGWNGYARLGRVYSVERRGDDVWVRGTVATGGGYDGDYGRESGFQCKFDDGRVRSLRLERPGYANGY